MSELGKLLLPKTLRMMRTSIHFVDASLCAYFHSHSNTSPRRPEGSRPGLLGTSSKSPTDR